ncbi:MAG TPA: DUF202 domain-containing protein [Chloroflexota bacterium]|nr:DUF202 domain-containing protein [Chloroflexota bacterium]
MAESSSKLRDLLANERTFLAWMRTSITMVGLGFVVAKFGLLLREIGGPHIHPLTARAGAITGTVIVVGGVLAAIFATLKFLQIHRGIEEGRIAFTPALDLTLAAVIGAVSIVLAGYLIVTA